MRIDRVLFVAVLMTTVATVTVNAAVLCRKKAGTISARDACKKKESPLDLSPLVAPAAPVVRDAGGALVGPIVDVAGTDLSGATAPRVLRRLGGVVVLLSVDATGFPDTAPNFYYAQADCAGPVLLLSSAGRLVVEATVRSNIAYYAAGTPSLTSAQSVLGPALGSCLGSTPVPPNLCCYNQPSPLSVTAVPATTVDLTTLMLATPFHVDGP